MPERGFVPFGEFLPDLHYLANPGLVKAANVVPAYGDYISAPAIETIADPTGVNEAIVGLHYAKSNGRGYVLTNNAGVGSDLQEIQENGTITNRTRTAALNYTSFLDEAHGTTFGDNVVMTLFYAAGATTAEPTQYLAPGAARFANMITSTFAPRGVYPFSLRGNLFMAKCLLPANYDTLVAGLNDTLVVWSQTENIRAFGSKNVDPQLTGTGFQPLNYDIGDITAAVAGGDYGIIGMRNGIVRVDGPSYTFRVVDRDRGCVATAGGLAMCAAGADVYYMSGAGLYRLPGGEGPAEPVGKDKLRRWLTDSSFHADAFNGNLMNLAYDAAGDLVFLSYRHLGGAANAMTVVYNVGEDRFSYWPGVLLLYASAGRPNITANWLPGRDIRFTTNQFDYQRLISGQAAGGAAVLARGYLQLKPENTVRFLRVRPIYNVVNQAAIEKISVVISSTNKPYATPTVSATYSTLDPSGWITTPGVVNADFHSLAFTLTASSTMPDVIEYTGFEYEIEMGPPSSA